ncbi:MAG: hypothetical protein OXI11_10960 [Gammaproteobacteria bacterium]|nr:hypothetical protein [Gammaproteobacteria bacterium]
MPKRLSDLPSQGAALSAAIARQQLDLRKISRVVDTRSIFRDLERMQRIAGASSTVRDLERIQRTAAVSSAVRGLERIQRVAVSSSVFRDVRRIGMALSENNIAKDCQRIAEALQTQQQRAISAQRLLLRSTAFDALKRIKRATELRQRQLRSIALTVSTSPFANAVERMNLAFSGSAFAAHYRCRTTHAGASRCRTPYSQGCARFQSYGAYGILSLERIASVIDGSRGNRAVPKPARRERSSTRRKHR